MESDSRGLAGEFDLPAGSRLDVQRVDGALVLWPKLEEENTYSLEEMLAIVTPESIHQTTDWGQLVGVEHW